MQNSNSSLLQEIERFLDRSELSASAFGQEVMGDRHLVRRLRDGKTVTLPTADKIRGFIKDWKPRPKSKANPQREHRYG
jgi:5-formyltetrahydrofolate cyclo-ligase